MRPVREKTYQDHTFALSIFYLSLMMTILFTSRWNSFLIALAWWRYANCSPTLWERPLLTESVFTYSWSSFEWQASSMWSLRDGSSWSCTTFFHSSLYRCLENAHDVSPHLLLQDILDISSIITWPIFELLLWLAHWSSLDLLLFLLISTLTPTYGPSIDYGLNLQIYLNETLVHMDCH